MSRLVVLDNEAVQALRDFRHPKHRKVLSQVQVVAQRKRRAVEVSFVVPTTVRVEAGWDRTAPSWALVNRVRIKDETLGASQANIAAMIRRESDVSVVDAHLGAVIRTASAGHITVVTSDPVDIAAVSGSRTVTIVSI